jgi:uncharacterized protein
VDAADPHLPYAVPIEAYGKGGFRFADMSHRGSLLCLPDGIWASPVTQASQIDETALGPVFERRDTIKHLLIGTGPDMDALPAALRRKLRESDIVVETMATGTAIRTYNILIEEGRPVAALLIAVD